MDTNTNKIIFNLKNMVQFLIFIQTVFISIYLMFFIYDNQIRDLLSTDPVFFCGSCLKTPAGYLSSWLYAFGEAVEEF